MSAYIKRVSEFNPKKFHPNRLQAENIYKAKNTYLHYLNSGTAHLKNVIN
jgi:hypothetical protein